jgi:hypothetical protein
MHFIVRGCAGATTPYLVFSAHNGTCAVRLLVLKSLEMKPNVRRAQLWLWADSHGS